MIQKLRLNNNEKGFTLIELMIVIAIIGILSAIAIPNFLAYRERGKDSAAETTANNFMSLAVAYVGDTGNQGPWDGTDGCIPGFRLGDTVQPNAGGNFTYDDDGTFSGSVVYSHVDSSNEFTVGVDANGNPQVTGP